MQQLSKLLGVPQADVSRPGVTSLVLLHTLLLALIFVAIGCSKAPDSILGESIDTSLRTASVVDALQPNSRGIQLVLEGSVYAVCKAEGCWLVLDDGASRIRLTFADPGIYAPTDIERAKIKVMGSVVEEVLDPQTATEFYQQAGKDTNVVADMRMPIFKVKGAEIFRN